jgi:hypothetical protein
VLLHVVLHLAAVFRSNVLYALIINFNLQHCLNSTSSTLYIWMLRMSEHSNFLINLLKPSGNFTYYPV